MSDNIGGIGALLVVAGPPIAGTVIGALVAKKHRVVGGLAGFGVGLAAVFAYSAYVNRQSQATVLANMRAQPTLHKGVTYALTHPDGTNLTTPEAISAGFTNVQLLTGGATGPNGELIGVWNGQDGAFTPTAIIAKS